MNRSIMAAIIMSAFALAPAASMAKAPMAKKIAPNFVSSLIKNADGAEDEVKSIGITCPVRGTNINPFIGSIMIRHADYEINKSIGVLVISKPAEQPDGPLTVFMSNTGEDFDGPVKGVDLQFSQPNGTFYISVFKNGTATIEVGEVGKTPSKPLSCKVIPFDDAR